MYAIQHESKTYTPNGAADVPAPVHCAECNALCTADGISAGFAVLPDGRILCNTCAGALERKSMIAAGAAVLYFTPEPPEHQPHWTHPDLINGRIVYGRRRGKITNFTGHLEFHCTYKTGGHNWRGCKRIDAWFTGPDGYIWHGVHIDGGYSQIIRCKRTKRQA